MGMNTSGIILGGNKAVDHQIVHSDVAVHHCGAHMQPAHIWTMHGGGKDDGIQTIHEVAGPRRGTGGRVTRRIL